MNKFVVKMLELGAELDKAVSPIEISMVLNDAEILYRNHIEQLTIPIAVGRSEQFNCGKERVYGEERCKLQCDMCNIEHSDN